MGNVSHRFLLCFFDAFLMVIIFVNYLIWSGAYVDIVGGTNYDLSNTYFGFQSVYLMINSYGQVINSQPLLSIASFQKYLSTLVNDCLLGLPQLATELGKSFTGQSSDVLAALKTLVTFLTTFFILPFRILLYLLLCIGCVLFYAFSVIAVVFLAFAGQFNVPIDIPLPSMPISQVVDTLRITVPILI